MKHDPLRDPVRFVDQRTNSARFLHKALRYLFPDHWSFLLGEMALYAFIVLVATGVFLALFFEPSLHKTVYDGSYEPLRGAKVSYAYGSAVDLSFDVKAGLLMRQTHHWAADFFVAAIVVHLLRVFFTGAFRKPRELTYLVGLAMLMLALLEGYLGYSMVDDLLSGMGLAIGYGVALSMPLIGGNLGLALWGAPYPGDPSFESRMFIAHVFLLPIAIGTLIAIHVALIAARHHTQFRRLPGQSERRLVGVPTFPGQAPRSLALMVAVAAVLVLLGGLVQINPIWLWGPYETALGTNGAQPDWYLGWLIGGLRLVPWFRRHDRRQDTRAEPVLGRRAVPARRVRRARRVALARAAAHRRPGVPQRARPPARRAAAHGARLGVPELGLPRVLRRLLGPPVRLPRDQLRDADLVLAHRCLGLPGADRPDRVPDVSRPAAHRGGRASA